MQHPISYYRIELLELLPVVGSIYHSYKQLSVRWSVLSTAESVYLPATYESTSEKVCAVLATAFCIISARLQIHYRRKHQQYSQFLHLTFFGLTSEWLSLYIVDFMSMKTTAIAFCIHAREGWELKLKKLTGLQFKTTPDISELGTPVVYQELTAW